MTALCGGGTSSSKPGFGQTVAFTASAIAALLNNIPTRWAVPLAGFIGLATYDLSTFCNSDPPALPTINAIDVANLLAVGNPLIQSLGAQKFADLVSYYAWFQMCQCDSVSTPAPTPGQAAPTGMPNINPPAVGQPYPTGQACQSWQYNFPNFASGDPFAQTPLVPIGAITHFSIDLTGAATHSDTGQWGFNVRWYNSSRTQILPTLIASWSTSGSTLHAETDIPTGTAFYNFAWGASLGDPTNIYPVQANVNAYCGTVPGGGGGYPTPCPEDPYITAEIDQILALVRLIQRQIVPFSYVDGATHAGLSGDGHFDVQGLLGCRVTITGFGSELGRVIGDPDTLYNAGWINFGDSHGYSSRHQINASPIQFFPRAAGQFTRIGYSLPPGITVSITEIIREP